VTKTLGIGLACSALAVASTISPARAAGGGLPAAAPALETAGGEPGPVEPDRFDPSSPAQDCSRQARAIEGALGALRAAAVDRGRELPERVAALRGMRDLAFVRAACVSDDRRWEFGYGRPASLQLGQVIASLRSSKDAARDGLTREAAEMILDIASHYRTRHRGLLGATSWPWGDPAEKPVEAIDALVWSLCGSTLREDERGTVVDLGAPEAPDAVLGPIVERLEGGIGGVETDPKIRNQALGAAAFLKEAALLRRQGRLSTPEGQARLQGLGDRYHDTYHASGGWPTFGDLALPPR